MSDVAQEVARQKDQIMKHQQMLDDHVAQCHPCWDGDACDAGSRRRAQLAAAKSDFRIYVHKMSRAGRL